RPPRPGADGEGDQAPWRQALRRDGRPRAPLGDRRDHAPPRRALRQHVRRHRDRLPSWLGEPDSDRRGTHTTLQAAEPVLPGPARRSRRSRRARRHPGELVLRGPTLFSGYWDQPEVNGQDFRGGWFHLGDVFVRNGDGSVDFVDRVKYLIKSGGENVYPAEIERVM